MRCIALIAQKLPFVVNQENFHRLNALTTVILPYYFIPQWFNKIASKLELLRELLYFAINRMCRKFKNPIHCLQYFPVFAIHKSK